MRRALLILSAAFVLAGCGTYAPSPFTATPTPTRTATATASPPPTSTFTPSATATRTPTQTSSATATFTHTPTVPPTDAPTEPPAATPFVVTTPGDVARGDDLFHHGKGVAPACINCHTDVQSAFSLGPSLKGISERALTRPNAVSAENYLHHSIVDPTAFLVPGFRNIMYADYANQLTEQDINDIIAYLMTK